jgi:hypothetical protein
MDNNTKVSGWLSPAFPYLSEASAARAAGSGGMVCPALAQVAVCVRVGAHRLVRVPGHGGYGMSW